MAASKARNWSFILYPESIPADWLQRLQDTHLPIALSPLHDMDFNPDGEIKKAHYHGIVCFDGPTTFNNVKELITEPLNAPIPIQCRSVRGNYRYFTHLDNPDKFQYSSNDIQLLNGFDISAYLSNAEITKMKIQIHELIIHADITEIWDLMEYLRKNEYYDFYDVVSKNTIYFGSLIKSRKYKVEKFLKKIEHKD